jgi:hypothetical protein
MYIMQHHVTLACIQSQAIAAFNMQPTSRKVGMHLEQGDSYQQKAASVKVEEASRTERELPDTCSQNSFAVDQPIL